MITLFRFSGMAFSFAPGRLHQSAMLGELYEDNIAIDFFADMAWAHQKATPRENWSLHFDYTVKKDDKNFRIEVKSPKRCRSTAAADNGLILLEHTGITGKPGWLQGSADYVLQFLAEDLALCYAREQALNAFPPVAGAVPRCKSYDAPIGLWFGREGLSRKGLPNEDIIRWDSVDTFCAKVSRHRFYVKRNDKWQEQLTAERLAPNSPL